MVALRLPGKGCQRKVTKHTKKISGPKIFHISQPVTISVGPSFFYIQLNVLSELFCTGSYRILWNDNAFFFEKQDCLKQSVYELK